MDRSTLRNLLVLLAGIHVCLDSVAKGLSRPRPGRRGSSRPGVDGLKDEIEELLGPVRATKGTALFREFLVLRQV
jgi:hypothetical protein